MPNPLIQDAGRIRDFSSAIAKGDIMASRM